MIVTLPVKAKENGTYGIRATFLEVSTDDEEGTPVTPNPGLTWNLTDAFGNIVNGRENVPIVPDASVVIVLQGDDLALPDGGYPVMRYVTIRGTYNSVLGNDLVLLDEVSFQIINLRGAP